MTYELHIYTSTGGGATYVLESDTPFLPIQKGDILNPRGWIHEKWNSVYERTDEHPNGVILRVIGFEHQFSQMRDGTINRHILMVYTQKMDDLGKNRP